MKYGEILRRKRAEAKAGLLVLLRQAEEQGRHVSLYDLAGALGRSRSGLTILWHELAQEGKIAYPAEERRSAGQAPNVPSRELAARIAKVREARLRKWKSYRSRNPPPLTPEELEEVLPN
jgi:hypothetical protein